MKEPYPIPPRMRTVAFSLAVAVTGCLAWLMPRPPLTRAAPYGIVSLELAGSTERASAILSAWDAPARQRAHVNVLLDYVFLLAYSTGLSLACLWAARRWQAVHARHLAGVGLAVAWLQWLAAALDAVENIGLLRMLDG